MSSIPALLDELVGRNIRVSLADGRLRCSAAPEALTPEVLAQLRSRKAEIVEFLRKAEALARQPEAIVPLQPRGTRIPVYAVTGHNGDVFSYCDIARSLGEEQPFFGLQPPGLSGRSAPRARVEALAAYFAAQIRAFQPSGSLIVAGYCAGGAVAYELARQLAAAGTEPQVLILFGCAHPHFYRFSLRYWGERVALHARAVAQLPSLAERWRYLAERLRQRIKQMRDERTPPGTDPDSLAKFRFERGAVAAVRRYTPRPYGGRVCLLIPKRGWLRENGGAGLWRAGAPRTEEYYGPDSVDAERMLLDPDAAVFAELFRRCLA